MTLYTKIRPKTFDEVKGQDFTVNNLRAQSIRNRFFQVIILAGQYGAGKTTLARIVAAAANCINKDARGNPCGACDGCRSVTAGSIDFLEIDGASNTGVDHVRELTNWLHERPIGKRKVVIIDEVHMLSRQAFNALLKTLEEPPAYALIILCTTEAERIPATIRSRSACYTITQIPDAIICEHLLEVASKHQIPIEPEAARLIASYANGAMRNALKILEQLSSGEEEITVKIVQSVLGMSGKEELFRIIQAMLSGNYPELLAALNTVVRSGKSLLTLTEELLNETTSLLLKKIGISSSDQAILEEYSLERFCEFSAKISWLYDELKNTSGSGIASFVRAARELNTSEISISGKINSLEKQVRLLSDELQSLKSCNLHSPHAIIPDEGRTLSAQVASLESNETFSGSSDTNSDTDQSEPFTHPDISTAAESTDFDAIFSDWGFDSFDVSDDSGFFENALESPFLSQTPSAVTEEVPHLSGGELAKKMLTERISHEPVIKEKLLLAEWITQEEHLLLKVLPEHKSDILLFVAASGIKNITIC